MPKKKARKNKKPQISIKLVFLLVFFAFFFHFYVSLFYGSFSGFIKYIKPKINPQSDKMTSLKLESLARADAAIKEVSFQYDYLGNYTNESCVKGQQNFKSPDSYSSRCGIGVTYYFLINGVGIEDNYREIGAKLSNSGFKINQGEETIDDILKKYRENIEILTRKYPERDANDQIFLPEINASTDKVGFLIRLAQNNTVGRNLLGSSRGGLGGGERYFEKETSSVDLGTIENKAKNMSSTILIVQYSDIYAEN